MSLLTHLSRACSRQSLLSSLPSPSAAGLLRSPPWLAGCSGGVAAAAALRIPRALPSRTAPGAWSGPLLRCFATRTSAAQSRDERKSEPSTLATIMTAAKQLPQSAATQSANATFVRFQQIVRNIAVGAIGASAFYLIIKWSYDAIMALMTLSFIDSGKLGFYAGGIFSTAAMFGIYSLAKRHATVTPDTLKNLAMLQLQQDVRATAKLGPQLTTGKFTAYAYSGGLKLGNQVPGWMPIAYSPTVLEIMFQVRGASGSGIATSKVVKKKGVVEFLSLVLDMDSGDKIILQGSPEDVIYQGSLKIRDA